MYPDALSAHDVQPALSPARLHEELVRRARRGRDGSRCCACSSAPIFAPPHGSSNSTNCSASCTPTRTTRRSSRRRRGCCGFQRSRRIATPPAPPGQHAALPARTPSTRSGSRPRSGWPRRCGDELSVEWPDVAHPETRRGTAAAVLAVGRAAGVRRAAPRRPRMARPAPRPRNRRGVHHPAQRGAAGPGHGERSPLRRTRA